MIETLASKANVSKNKSELSKIQVSVIGTEEHNLSAINKFTAYVIEVKMSQITQKLYLRYSEIKELEDYSRKHYKSLEIPHFSSLQWF